MARVLIDGPPASGKSTLALHTVDLLRERGAPVFGFTTAEIRRGGRRTGFTVAGVASGRERVLAVRGGAQPHVGSHGPRVGSYAVDIEAFEEVALVEIENGLELGAALIVDEVGKMELLSAPFNDLIDAIFAAPSALVTAQRPPHERIAQLIESTELRRIGLPRPDRAELPSIVADWLLSDALSSR